MKTPIRTRRPLALFALLTACILAATGCAGPATGDGHALLPAVATSSAAAASAASANQKSAAAATSSAVSAADADPLAGRTIVIDPGHDGGNAAHASEIAKLVPMGFGKSKACDNTGTNGNDGYPEHAFTFSVSLLVQQLLEAHGAKVILTRTNDTGVGPCVNVRAAIGNNAHADAAISIHGDGFAASGHGFQIIRATKSAGGAANDAASYTLSQALQATFLSESGLTPSTYIGTDGFEKRSDLAGLNLSTVPKVLVECGNMRNAGDIALMQSAAGRARIAKAIADGLIAYLTK
ncbi:N-acetylmuramoyl-L-alanine amidase [Actinospica robiniae]|uniref:N-acetylmuramoyl-L-alanine amidase n=1 Tax=Actinospica robiniae TaxID=304901 RepID=UPI00040630F7|nr:N-acetylmuramoyl-L-alanine amidase [Actinospica robiniae]